MAMHTDFSVFRKTLLQIVVFLSHCLVLIDNLGSFLAFVCIFKTRCRIFFSFTSKYWALFARFSLLEWGGGLIMIFIFFFWGGGGLIIILIIFFTPPPPPQKKNNKLKNEALPAEKQHLIDKWSPLLGNDS